jgi:toxin ParE1/3/4
MALILSDDADRDVTNIIAWYEQERAGLGREFYVECLAMLEYLERHPSWGTVLTTDPVYKTRHKRFPYAIYYRLHDETVYVLRVGHQHRHPQFWRQ